MPQAVSFYPSVSRPLFSGNGMGYGPVSSENPTSKEPPRKPDWLLLLMIGLFVLTLLIAWLVDFPNPLTSH